MGGASFVGPLDALSTVYAVSTGRRLRSAYTGPIGNIRSTGAGTPNADIGYTGANILDTAAAATLIGADTGVWTTLFDQSGNGINFVQTNASKQPLYEATGFNSKPSAKFDGSDDGMITSANVPAQSTWWGYIVSVALATGTSPELWAIVSFPDTVTGYRLFERTLALNAGQSIYYNNSNSGSSAMIWSNNVNTAHLLKGAAAVRYAKGSSGTTISDTTNNTIVGGIKSTIGYRNDASAYLNGRIVEVALFSGTPTAGQETALWADLNAFWGTPIP